jgi:hypothetical protein
VFQTPAEGRRKWAAQAWISGVEQAQNAHFLALRGD